MLTELLVATLSTVMLADANPPDGPFGVKMGSDPGQLPACIVDPKHPGGYVCTSLPKSHPDFRSFLLLSTKETGVCKITAIGNSISANGYGQQIKDKTDEIAQQVASTYGSWSDKFDFVEAGATFTEDQYWLMAVNRKERTYSYIWEGGKFPVRDNAVQAISIEAVSNGTSSGSVVLSFEYSNFHQCLAILKHSEASAF